jgi:hypothetical protein
MVVICLSPLSPAGECSDDDPDGCDAEDDYFQEYWGTVVHWSLLWRVNTSQPAATAPQFIGKVRWHRRTKIAMVSVPRSQVR